MSLYHCGQSYNNMIWFSFKSLGKEQVAYPHPQGPRLFCSFAIQDKENVINIEIENSTLFIAFIFLQSYKKGGFIIKKLSTLCTLIKKFTIYFHLYLYFHDIFNKADAADSLLKRIETLESLVNKTDTTVTE